MAFVNVVTCVILEGCMAMDFRVKNIYKKQLQQIVVEEYADVVD